MVACLHECSISSCYNNGVCVWRYVAHESPEVALILALRGSRRGRRRRRRRTKRRRRRRTKRRKRKAVVEKEEVEGRRERGERG